MMRRGSTLHSSQFGHGVTVTPLSPGDIVEFHVTRASCKTVQDKSMKSATIGEAHGLVEEVRNFEVGDLSMHELA